MYKIKILVTLMLIMTFILPVTGFAQEATVNTEMLAESSPQVQNTPDALPPVIISKQDPAPAQTTESAEPSVSPQNTAGQQQGGSGNALEQTFDPSQAAVEQDPKGASPAESPVQIEPQPEPEKPIVLPDPVTGTSTPPEILPIDPLPPQVEPLSGPATSTVPVLPPDPGQPPVDPQVLPTEPQETVAEFKQPVLPQIEVPAPAKDQHEFKFSFKLKNKIITSKQNPEWQSRPSDRKKASAAAVVPPVPQSDVSSAPNLAPSTQEGLNITGSCSDKYYVVLLYAAAEDYSSNPASYIYNKAFECTNGQYNYSLNDLPESIKDGDYYILIGGQGDRGSWKPITALTQISVQRQ
jgi:hypothetical protein